VVVNSAKPYWEIFGERRRVNENRRFFVEFEDPNKLSKGTIFHEWIVMLPRMGKPEVFCGRARWNNPGIDTLPPEGWQQ
jgi:hypothetical protein